MTTLSVRIPDEIEKRLNHLAQETGRSKTYYVREALLEHLDELEDLYLAMRRIEKPGKRWTLEELEKELDLDN